MSEQDERNVASEERLESDDTDDFELHKKKLTDEPRSEDEDGDDFEAHKRK